MRVSPTKTVVMVVSREETDCIVHLNGTQLKQVTEFAYLGVLFTSDGRQDNEISRRINQASGVLRELGSSVVGNTMLSRQAKLTIYKSLYRPILTYGHETWTLTESARSRIGAAEMRFLRRMLGVTRRDRIPNEAIRERVKVEPLLSWIEKSQFGWYGHTLRMNHDQLARQILFAVPEGRPPPGRPRKRWTDQMNELCRRISLNPDDAAEMALDRAEWKRLTSSLPPQPTVALPSRIMRIRRE